MSRTGLARLATPSSRIGLHDIETELDHRLRPDQHFGKDSWVEPQALIRCPFRRAGTWGPGPAPQTPS